MRRVFPSRFPTSLFPSLFAIGIVLVAGFVLFATLRFVTAVYGLSVDDGYIFLVYARNLAAGQGWSFNPGEVSFGTSSPLWALMLAATALVGADLIHAARILGGLFYAGAAALSILIFYTVTGNRAWALLTGVVMAGIGNLLLIAVSGMEVTAHSFFMLAFVYLIARWGMARPLPLGIVTGLFFLSRPDAVIAAPIFIASWWLVALASRRPVGPLLRSTGRAWLIFVGSALLVVAPWVIFVYTHTGKFLPTTHYAKLLSMPGAPETLDDTFVERVTHALTYAREGLTWIFTQNGLLISFPLMVVALLWLMGQLVAQVEGRNQDPAQQNRFTAQWVMVGLLLLLPLEYGWQTPWWYGGYLHRYILPVLPLALILTFLGGYHLLCMTGLYPLPAQAPTQPASPQGANSGPIWVGNALLLLVTLVILARSVAYYRLVDNLVAHYGHLIAENEDYRRSVAEWIDTHTPADARVGETFLGVGAIGYYANRYIVDAGGLVDGTILDYWAADGDPKFSEAETLHYFQAKGIDIVIGPPGMEKNPTWPLTPITQIHNQSGDLSWDGADFNTVVLFRPRP
jgi:hypothetical protein